MILSLLAAYGACPVVEWTAGARVQDDRLTEISGIVARSPDGVWVHNDSGGEPRLFGVTEDGRTAAVLDVNGARAEDWEDVARQPGGALVVGDIGDNMAWRDHVVVYEVSKTGQSRRMDVTYPGAPRDAEALVVDPRDGRLFLLTKIAGAPTTLFGVGPFREGATQAVVEGTWRFGGKVTAADVSPDGRWLAVRTYALLHLFRLPRGVARAFEQAPCTSTLPEMPQGEALAWTDAHTLVTVSEGAHPVLFTGRLGSPDL